VPNLALRTGHGWREVVLIDLPLFFGTTLSVVSFYVVSQRELGVPTNWLAFVGRLPLMLAVGIGLCINQTRAVLEALAGKETEFVRTPKHGVAARSERWTAKRYRAAKSLIPYFELLMGLYFTFAMVLAIRGQHFMSIPFLMLFLVGFFYVGVLSVHQRR
jgi:hypothetical protein